MFHTEGWSQGKQEPELKLSVGVPSPTPLPMSVFPQQDVQEIARKRT